MHHPKVYIAGPYTHPDPVSNTHRAFRVADQLSDAGLIPYIPHGTLLWHIIAPKPYEFFIEYDLHWLEVCHVVLRLDGASKGADKEVAHAVQLGRPVFHEFNDGIERIIKQYGRKESS